MPLDENELNKRAQDHAWNWFVFHAAQRMQAFNFFLVATTFLMAGYASLLEKHPGIAIFVSLMGAWMGFWFIRLDRRTRQLVNAGESVLKITQARLAEYANIPEIKILEQVDIPSPGATSYRKAIAAIEWMAVVGFVLAGACAAGLAICG